MNRRQYRKKPSTNFASFVDKYIFVFILFISFTIISLDASATEFTARTLGDYGNVTVMEGGGNYNAENPDGTPNVEARREIANEFFKTHKDEYDFLVIFTNFDFQPPQNGDRAFYQGVKNDTQGIGLDAFDDTASYGSNGKLQGTIDMGNIGALVTDPKDPKFEETLGLLSHALLHRWAAYVKFKDADGTVSPALLDSKGGHWSFLLDTAGSLMRGNTWHDNGDGTFTSTTPLPEMKYFSPLDLYLMGMIDGSQVPPMLLIDNPSLDPDRLPETGTTVSGTGRTVTIDDIIGAMGPRVPDAASSQKMFRTAFIFVTEPLTFTGSELAGIENIRNGGITRFSILTDGRSIMEVSARKTDDFPTNPGVEAPVVSSRTLPPSLNDGAAWLMSAQQSDGSWTDLSKTTERDTAEAALALKSVASAQKNYLYGVQWLAGASPVSTDFLSRKIEALAGSGQDVMSLVTDVLSRQNADGGWGSGQSFKSSAGDTAMALKALTAAGYANSAVIEKAIAYLAQKQNTDGGWGGEDMDGLVQESANVLSQLNTYRSVFPVEDVISRGSAWLVARQNADGGFGNSPSTVYDTAKALKTLRELNASTDVTNKAVGYMLAQQSSDGSWNQSSYQTAAALNVLLKATVEPDLSVQTENISTYPAVIKSLPQSVVINTEIWNLGQAGADATVALYRDEASDGNKISEQTLSFAGQSSTTIAFKADAQEGYEQRFIIVIDPDNLVQESNKLNNTATKIVKAVPNLDFEVLPEDITLSANPADMAQDVTIAAALKNRGTVDAYNVQVKFLIDDPSSPYEIITKTVGVIPANSSVVSEAVWRTNRAGADLPVAVEIDPLGDYAGFELIKTNNKASVPITVNPNGRANLTTSYRDMVITPSPANERGAAAVSALVKNEGFSAATDVVVNVYCGVPGYDGFLVGTKTVPLIDAGGETRVALDWPDIPVAGERIIYVQTVYSGEEIRTDDNDSFVMLTILTLPDLMLSANSITFVPGAPKDGDQVSARVVVQNAGEQSASSVVIKAYDGGAEVGSSVIDAVAGNGESVGVIRFNAAVTQGAHQITVVADPDNAIPENNKGNNHATRTLGVQNGSFWVTEPVISPNGDGIKDSTQFFFRLDAPAAVSVRILSRLGNVVRTFNEPGFENTADGNVTWDGLNNEGILVKDGLYRIEVREAGNSLLGTLSVEIDTDRSPITEALGTRYLLSNNLTCNLPNIADGNWKWFPDESAVAAVVQDDPNTQDYPAGLYTITADGLDVQRITPAAWKNTNAACEDTTKLPCERYYYAEFSVSTDSSYVAAVVYKQKAMSFYGSAQWITSTLQLVIMDRDGRNILTVESKNSPPSDFSIDKLEWSGAGDRLVYRIRSTGSTAEIWSVKPDGTGKLNIYSGPSIYYDSPNLTWSPDRRRLVYRTKANGVEELWSLKPDGTDKILLDSEASGNFAGFKWSPDSRRIAYVYSDKTVRLADLSGVKIDVFACTGWLRYFEWLGTEKIVLQESEMVRIVDAAGNGKYVDIPVNDTDYSVFPSPAGNAVAIAGVWWVDWDEAKPFFTVVDAEGNVLYEWKDSLGTGTCIARVENPVWSPDGAKIAFNELFGVAGDGWSDCYDEAIGPRLVAVEIKPNKEWAASALTDFTGWLPDGNYASDTLIPDRWLSDGAYLLSRQEIYRAQGWSWYWLRNDYYLTDVESGETKTLSPVPDEIIEWTGNFISPLDRYYTYYRQVDEASVCAGKGTKDLWSMRSLLNLTADLRITRKKTALLLKGTASDLNFESYKLEYADEQYPNVWNPVQPPSDSPSLNEIFTSWAPPYEGVFYVRLTVRDKAGNTATDRKRITWGMGSILTNVYKTPNIISPLNQDGIQDAVEVHYRVMEPANLEFAVLDQNKSIVRTITKSYTEPGEDFIEWDGRDYNDNPVPDGLYVITILDYELAVEVDNTLPDIGLRIVDVSNFKITYYTDPYSDLFAHATDKNIKEWAIEYGEGPNPQEWNEYMRGSADLPQEFDEGREIPLRVYSGGDLEWLAGKKIRIRALDTAGNVSTTIGNLREELFTYGYKVKNVFSYASKCDTCDCSRQMTYPGMYPLSVVETFPQPIVSMNLQYKADGGWFNAPATAGPASAFFNVDWINNYTGQDIAAIRIKAIDASGQELYSNEICMQKPAGGGGSGGGDGGGSGGGGGLGGREGSAVYLEIGYPEQACGLMSKPVGTVSLEGLISTGAVQLNSGGLYINEAGGKRLLQGLDIVENGYWNSLTKWPVKPAVIDASGFAEGVYHVSAAVSYLDLSSGNTGTIVSSPTQTLYIDRTSPVAQLYPSSCTEKKKDAYGEWRGILIQGTADDNIAVKRYELFYGLGDNPTEWLPALNRWVDEKNELHSDQISGNKTNKAILDTWDVTALIGKRITLKLQVLDVGGNVSCVTKSFTIKDPIAITSIVVSPTLFSPNDDNFIDTTTVQYEVNQDAVVDVKAFKLVKQQDGSLALDGAPVKDVLSGFQYIWDSMGIASALWDGKNDAYASISDGLYGLAVTATDPCGYSTTRWVQVEIDSTPPETRIIYPNPADPITKNIIEVTGTADDPHFSNYLLEAGEGEVPTKWSKILEGTNPVKEGFLGEWNSYGVTGPWSFKLTATDTVGNKNVTTVVAQMGERKDLIKDLAVLPRVFSPNNDTKLDTASVTFELAYPSGVTLAVLDSNNVVRKTADLGPLPAGVHSALLDGKDDAGTVVSDGLYAIRLTAALSSNPTDTQAESVTVFVDTSAPAVDIQQPQTNAYLNAMNLAVAGSVVDPNLVEYSITFVGETGSLLVDRASVQRENYSFGSINDLAEGSYSLTVVANDLGQNEINQTIPFTIDRTPPAVKLDTPQKDEYYGGTGGVERNQSLAVVNVTGGIVEKNLESFDLRYGSGDAPVTWTDLATGTTVTGYPSPYAWKVGKDDGIPDGQYTLSLFALDKAGQTGETKVKITIDNTVPTVAITSHQEGDYFKEPVDVTGTADDLNLGNYDLEFSAGQCAGAFKWATIKTGTAQVQDAVLGKWQALPEDGDYCLRIKAADKVSQTAEAVVNVKVDTHPPAAPQLSGKAENKVNANLTWPANAEPDLAGYNLYRNGEKVNTSLITDLAYLDENLAEGVYTYTLTAQDFAGWESPASDEVRVRIDLTGPDAHIRSPRDGDRVGNLIDIKGTAFSNDDFKQYRVSVGQGAAPSAWALLRTSPVPVPYGVLTQWDAVSLVENETYVIKLEAEDIAGNITTNQISVVIDNTPPDAPVLSSVSGLVSDVTATWQANAEPDLAGYLLFRNDQLVNVPGVVIGNLKPYLLSTATTAYLDRSLPDGTFRYYLVAMDEAGNTSDQSNTIEVTIDTHPPHADVIDPLDQAVIGRKFMIRTESPDLDIASVQFQYQNIASSPTATADWLNLGGPVTNSTMMTNMDPGALGLAYDDYRLRAVAADRGNNTDPAPGYITITYTDLTPPAAPTGLTARTNGGTVALTWTANTESDVEGYNVYRDGQKINGQLVPCCGLSDENLADGLYSYTVTAVDGHQNESKASEPAFAKVYAPVMTQPYTPVGQSALQIRGTKAAAQGTAELFTETTSGLASLGTATADADGAFTLDVILAQGINTFFARVTDGEGNVSKDSNTVVVAYNDTPATPTGLAASVEGSDVSLTWNRNVEPDLLGYNVFRDGKKVNASDAVVPMGTRASSNGYYSSGSWSVVDDDPATFWMPQDNTSADNPAWWEMDLASPELVSRVSISWGTDTDGSGNEVLYAGKDFEVQVWSADANAWITQAKATGNAVKDNVFDFNPSYRTDKVRIFITDSTDVNSAKQVRLAEVGVIRDNLVSFATTSTPSYDDLNLPNNQYGYTVTAVDTYGFESRPTGTVTAEVNVAPPSAPVLSASVLNSDVTLTWTASPEPGTESYFVYKNAGPGWTRTATVQAPETTFVDAALPNGTYTYRVTAADAAGNESQPSNTAAATVLVATPAQPTLTVTPTAEGALQASWTYIGTPAAGYNLYRGLTAGGPYARVNGGLIADTAYLDAGLTLGITYYYVVAAVDGAGNEGSYSNEASGTPEDTAIPAKPILYYPTIPGRPLNVRTSEVTIIGEAGPNAQVVLRRDDGTELGSMIASSGKERQEISIPEYGGYGAALSPDGTVLAYTGVDGDGVWSSYLVNIETLEKKYYPVDREEPHWSPNGEKILYYNYDYDRLDIYDVATGTFSMLTDGSYYEYNGVWSPDGTRVAFETDRAWRWHNDIWLKDLTTGDLTQLSYNGGTSPAWSPDGTLIAFNASGDLTILNINDGTETVLGAYDPWGIQWSGDGTRLCFVSYNDDQIYVINADGSNPVLVSDITGWYESPRWLPSGKVIYVTGDWDTLYTADPATGENAVTLDSAWIEDLGVTSTGLISYGDEDTYSFVMLTPAGRFAVDRVRLLAGENTIYAEAINNLGVAGPASDPITLILDMSLVADLAITDDDVYLYPPYPIAGEQMAVNAVVSNPSQADVADVNVDVYVWNGLGQLELLSSQTIPTVAAGSAELVTATWDSTGKAGDNMLIVVVDPSDRIAESNETNNLAIRDFYVADKAGVSMSTTTDASEYRSSQNANITVTMRNTGPAVDGVLNTWVEDASGYPVVQFEAKTVSLAYAQDAAQANTWNTGSTYAGSYVVRSVLKDGSGAVLAESAASLNIVSDAAAALSVVTDKIAYGPNEPVRTDFTVRNTGTNSMIPVLRTDVSISDPSGAVLYTEEKTVSDLMPGASVDLNALWNTGSYAPGTYPVAVQLKDPAGTVIAAGSASIVITASSRPSKMLNGRISVDKQSVFSGDTVNIAFNVANIGNVDLAAVALSVKTVHAVNQTIYGAITAQPSLATGATYSATGSFTTGAYTAMDYLVVLSASVNGTEEALAGTYFRVEGAPTSPSVVSPPNGTDVMVLSPTLVVNNASDPNDDNLKYEFEVYSDPGLTNLVLNSGLVSEQTGTTNWTVPLELQENARYFWRTRAYDNKLYSTWMDTAWFRVNTVNDPPSAPAPTSPLDGSSVSVLAPALTVTNAADPDSAGLTYNFDIALDPDFVSMVTFTRGVFEGQGTTTWQVPVDLAEDTLYFWRAQADDWQIEGPWSTTSSFFVNTFNQAPSAPTVTAPAAGSSITASAADVIVSNSTDPDSPMLTYYFELDTVNTFDSPALVRSNGIPEGQSATSWSVANLADNTWYFVRAKASDGEAESVWSAESSFFVNTTNDPPSVPVLANPSNGSGVTVSTPTLSVYDSVDPDNDAVTYEIEVYSDPALTSLVTGTAGVAETPQITAWTVAVSLTENSTYYWRARAFDGKAASDWFAPASFFVNAANDAPEAPVLNAPDEASTVTTLTPTLSVENAFDPDSDALTYDFEVYSAGVLVQTVSAVSEDSSGITSLVLATPLLDNTIYQWRARAYDGERYGAWMAMASFKVHLPQTGIKVEIEFEPETLKKASRGTWVMVEIELPHGYRAEDVDIASIRLEGTVPAEPWPHERKKHHHEHGCDEDHEKHDHGKLKVKFKRSDVIKVLPAGKKVSVHVSGMVGTTTFDGVDVIRVID